LRFRQYSPKVLIESPSAAHFTPTCTGTNFIKGTQTAVISGSTAEALDKGNIGTLGWFFGKNNSATITINIYSAVGGTLITADPT
jgi:hypothetical protein